MARAMWKGAIQFGLVTIPVKLYLATESNYQVRFNMLHEKDLSRIQMKTLCPVDDEVISRSDTVKGYEYAPDQYVVITDEDLEKVPLKTVRTIEIEQFTKAERDDTNTRFVKQAYYVEPDKIGRKAFYLLKSVLAEEDLTAICKVVIKDREALASLDPFGDTMLLTTLHWPDEIRSTDGAGPARGGARLQAGRAGDGQAARLGDDRRVRAGEVQGRVPRRAHAGHRGEDRGPRAGRPGAGRGERQAHRPHGRARGVGQGDEGRPRSEAPVSVADAEEGTRAPIVRERRAAAAKKPARRTTKAGDEDDEPAAASPGGAGAARARRAREACAPSKRP